MENEKYEKLKKMLAKEVAKFQELIYDESQGAQDKRDVIETNITGIQEMISEIEDRARDMLLEMR